MKTIVHAILLTCLLGILPLEALAGDSIPTTRELVRILNKIDTNYVEPEHYNFTLMVQNTNTYEIYRLKSKNGHSVMFSPRPGIKVGPYFGWRWAFAGYTFDVGHLASRRRQEVDLSIYSQKIGADLFYRKSGDDYRLRDIKLSGNFDTSPLENKIFDGLNVEVWGFNVYYIFNHRKFSYPAAFSQSTRQKKSAGSLLLGIGYSQHDLRFDYKKLTKFISDNIPQYEAQPDSGLMFERVHYSDFSVSAGYGYNFVVAKNLLLAASLSLSLGYKQSHGDKTDNDKMSFRDFAFNSLMFDGVGRFGIVWNNDRFFAGSSVILHAYNYRKPQFSTNNFFGNLNIYTGWKFGKRKRR